MAGCESIAYVRLHDLRLHVLRAHTTTRPFPCKVTGCESSFVCMVELRRHIKTHTDLIAQLTAAAEMAEKLDDMQIVADLIDRPMHDTAAV